MLQHAVVLCSSVDPAWIAVLHPGPPRLLNLWPGLDGSDHAAKHGRMSRAINTSRPPETQIAPLTPARWADLEIVFGDGRGACGQCWCMPRREFETSIGARTRQLFRARVEAGPRPGLLAYRDGAPVGWVQVGPRADVPGWNGARRLTAPRVEAPAGHPRVWGIPAS